MYVNTIHAHDSYYLRNLLRASLINDIEIAAIHDGFAVAYYNTGWLIGAANDTFSAELTAYSTTILI